MPARAPIAFALLLLLLLAATPWVGLSVADDARGEPDAERVARALDFIASRQLANGRWGLPTQGYLGEAASSAGADIRRWPSEERSAYAAHTPEEAACRARFTLPTEVEDCIYKSVQRIVHGVGASGYDPRAMNGIDGVARVRERFLGGQFGEPFYLNDDVWGILALRAAGVPASDAQIQAAADTIVEGRADDGGWTHSPLAASGTTDMTGQALAALSAAGRRTHADDSALAFLDSRRDASGGYRDTPTSSPSCQSTVWAIHARSALGVPDEPAALEFLRGLQNPDGGFSINGGASDLFCTVEAIIVLSGERYPLPSFAAATPPAPSGHAGERVLLSVPEFDRAVWTLGDLTLTGRQVSTVFDVAGVRPYRLVAETATTRARLEGVLTILSARPIVGELPASIVVHRPAPLALDLSRAHDPDGSIVAFAVDWGDGNATNATSHVYAAPGAYDVSVRARDDAGVWSRPATMRVDVPNRAPTLAPLPPRILADRMHAPILFVNATDPDGDALAGTGPRALAHATLGNATVEVVVVDAWGAASRANLTVEVVNLPPRVTLTAPARAVAGEEIVLLANATDDDGPAPTLAWSTGAGGPRARFEAAGPHVVRVVATDADGATAEASATILVDAPAPGSAPVEEGPAREPPAIRELDAAFDGPSLVVRFDAEGDATLRWRSDAGEGELAGVEGPLLRLPLDGATWASVEIVVERDGLVASQETGILVAPARAVDAAPVARATPAEPTPVVVAAIPPAPERAADAEVPIVPAGLRTPEDPSRETPGPSLALAVALALALAATRRRRAA